MEDIFLAASVGLKKTGYEPLSERTNERGETEGFCFCRLKGAVLNIVVLIDGRVCGEPEACFREICDRVAEGQRGKAKTVCLGILIEGDTDAFLEANDFDPMADVVKIRWAYNDNEGILRRPEGAPDRFDGVENIFRREKTPLEAEKSSGSFLKTRKIIVTYLFIMANLLMYAVLTLDGGSENTETLLKYGAIYAPLIKEGQLYRLFSYMFLHIGAVHLFSNMFALYIFGTRCEKYFGYLRFISVYVLSGLGCAVLSCLFSGGAVSAGASGAVLGIMGAALGYSFLNKIKMDGLDTYVFVLIALINLGFGFVYKDIDNAGHIGGFLTGLALGFALGFLDKKKVLKNETAL